MLHEKYRPTDYSQVLGQSKAVAVLSRLATTQWGGRSLWISGQSGQGKTTLARIYAGQGAECMNVTELDSSDLTPAKLKSLEYDSHYVAMGEKQGRAYIINEAHGLRKDTIRQLLVMLERVPECCVWIFTTTKDGQESLFEDMIDAHPLLSRCICISLATRGLAPIFAARAQEIARENGLDGKPIARYVKLVQEKRNNFRAVLSAIEACEMLTV